MKVELLAPAGSYESMTAAYKAGADAVYLGGMKFGARAFADNLDTERMKEAIDYAHMRGKKLYLTVNTLLKQRETEELYDYLLPFYREGLDAVIVQDFGVFQMVKEAFPDMDIHASTQMTVTGVRGAAWLKERGASRVVTARELSLEEIHQIYEQVPVEIESFVHGALCFCYSGQCLLSSMIGGRSGNRGRCAQPCRLPYQLYEDGRQISSKNQPYLMSPKDMCTLDLIPDLIENGVYSFKMEGRMKKPEYTAGITEIYRTYIDRYLEYGRKQYKVSKEDRAVLMDLYNRGGFSTGYYRQHNGKDMMSMERPNHWGTEAARVQASGKQRKNIQWKALEELHVGDVLELRQKRQEQNRTEITMTQRVPIGGLFSVKTGKKEIASDALFYRTRNEELLGRLKKEYLDTPYKVDIDGELLLRKGQPSHLRAGHHQVIVEATGNPVQMAQKRPVTEDEVRRQLGRLGQTDFQWHNLKIDMDEDVFLPMQELNELRRTVTEKLKEQMLLEYMRKERKLPQLSQEMGQKKQNRNLPELAVQVQTEEQFRETLAVKEAVRIYMDSIRYDTLETFQEKSRMDIQRCHDKQKECWYVMPWIFREEKRNYLRHTGQAMEVLKKYDGVLVKNLEEIQYLQKEEYHGKIALDQNMYIWNRAAWRFWEKEAPERITLPAELTDHELKELASPTQEMVVYGYTPLMVTAQCFQKNTCGCTGIKKVMQLKDRKNKYFPVKNDCTFCYNILYNSAVTELADQKKTVDALSPESVRICFTIEEATKVREVLQRYTDVFVREKEGTEAPGDFTRGHLKRGVE